MKKLWDLKKVHSNLELEGQGCGIIMGVTRLLLLGPFYYIQTNFLYFFAHDCSYKDASSKCIWTLNPPPSSYFYNLMKNVKTNRDPLLAAAGVALLGGNSIRQMLVFLTQKPIFSSISYMRVLFEYMILLELTLKYLGGGWFNPLVGRSPGI